MVLITKDLIRIFIWIFKRVRVKFSLSIDTLSLELYSSCHYMLRL